MGEIISQVIVMILNVIEPLVLDLFWRTISKRKPNKTVFRVLGIAMLVVYVFLNPILLEWTKNSGIAMYIVNNIVFLFNFVYAATFYTLSKRAIFVYLAARFFMGTLLEYIVTFVYVLVLKCDVENLLESSLIKVGAVVILQMSSFIVLYLLTKVHKKYGREIDNRRTFYLLLIVFIVDVIIFGVFFCSSINEQTLQFDVTIIHILVYEAISLCVGYWMLDIKRKEKEYLDVIEFTNRQIEMLSDTQDKIASSQKILHDITNHLCTMRSMAEKGMCKEIQEYIEKLIPEVKKSRISDIGNSVLSVILFERKAMAKRFDVMLECNIGVEDIKIPIVELNAIISNMIDNAIEATTKVSNRKERIVEFRVYIRGDNLVMECRNPYIDEPIIDEDGTFLTSKADKKNHGKGIQIIFEYVERYDGDVDIHYKKGEFVMKIILSNEMVV